jgi:general stress protein 26
MEVATFEEVAEEFERRVRRIVWCTVATVDRRGRPRSRILHPIWEGPTGWIATGRRSLKAKHLAANPHVSLTYWDPRHEQVYVDCRAEWEDEPAAKRRLWELYNSLPPPYGYDLALFWPGGPEDPNLGLLKLTPWRLELWSLQEMARRRPPTVWRPRA